MVENSSARITETQSQIACQLLPVITYNGQLRSSVVLIQVEIEKTDACGHEWSATQDHILEVLRGCIRAGGDFLLPVTNRALKSESFFVVASIDLEHAQIMLQRIRERMSGTGSAPGLHSIKVSAKGIWLPTRSGDESLESLSMEVAERVICAALLQPQTEDQPK